ncbi:hypothetical protein U0070_001060 [Myodes glareolus]|uniref:Uncharacterized protein n=1 Tax=Myodes glareolus TaxID=447135 RepID=A0AAW0IX50_MYOGA
MPALSLRCDGADWNEWFGSIGSLVTRASFMSGKVDVVANGDPFIDLSSVIYMFQDDSSRTLPLASSIAQSKLRTGSLPPTGRPLPSSRSKIPPTPNGVMLVLSK